MFNFNEILKNLGNIQNKTNEIQSQLEKLQITGDAGGGLVSITMNGNGIVKDIEIDKSLCKEEEKDALEELLISAFDTTQKKLRETVSEEVKKLTGGLNIPGFENFFKS